MLIGKHINNDVVIFSRWSRKSYAIFQSLKKVISIARLSIDICESSSFKKSSFVHLIHKHEVNEECDDFNYTNFSADEIKILQVLLSAQNNIDIEYNQVRLNNITYGEPIL